MQNLWFYSDGIKMNEIKCNFKLTSNGFVCDTSINGINFKMWYTEGLEMVNIQYQFTVHDNLHNNGLVMNEMHTNNDDNMRMVW